MENKLFALFLAVVIIVAMIHFMPKPLHKQLNLDDVTCQVFCRNTTAIHTDVGFGKIVQCQGQSFLRALAQCQGVDGVSFTFCATEDDFSALIQKLDVTVHTTQTLGNLTIVCGYSPKVVGAILLDGKEINVQIAFDGSVVTVGSPLILGSY